MPRLIGRLVWVLGLLTIVGVGLMLGATTVHASAKSVPGGLWVYPNNGQQVGDSVTLEAQAYPTYSGDPPISHVNFTAWYNNAWHVLCSVYGPTYSDVYECDWRLAGVVNPGWVTISFDVYDQGGGANYAPNGEHSIQYVPPPPGGLWVYPNNGQQVGDTVTLEAAAYPTNAGDPAISHVNFTAWYNNAWNTLCSVYSPTYSDVYECNWTLRGVISPGWVTISFDVYDQIGAANYAPNGEHSIDYVPPPPGGLWVYPSDGQQVGDTVTLEAAAYPTNAGDPAISHVNFTAWYNGAWHILCSVYSPTYSDVYECTWTLRGVINPGYVTISFDVYDQIGAVNYAPNGMHSIDYVPPPPGGLWVYPNDGQQVGDVVTLQAQAYPTNAGDPAISHVNFTAWYNNTWNTLCSVYSPTYSDVYQCSWTLRGAISPGWVTISFDVYDQSGNVNYAPNGEHSIDYVPPPPGGLWVAPADGATVGDTIMLAAQAYPTNVGDPAISHVNFTAWYNNAWNVLCSVSNPTYSNVYECNWTLRGVVSAGWVTISFDVYDQAGGANYAPNGEHSIHYVPPPPGGLWVYPSDGQQVGDFVTLQAAAYPTNAGDPAISHVNFTAWYNNAWNILCSVTSPTYSDVYECNWTLRGVVSPGNVTISFDVYDQAGGANYAPNGLHSINYVPPPPGGMWVAPANGVQVGDTVSLQAAAYPTNAGDPAISHVNFTAWYNSAWHILCSVSSPTSGNVYVCNWTLRGVISPGYVTISFDVYDQVGGVNYSPNGEHSIDYVPSPPSGVWVAPANGAIVADTVVIQAAAYPTYAGDPAISHVNFTAWYSNAWHVLCSVYAPTDGDVYTCSWTLRGVINPSSVTISFDVYDQAGGASYSPNGERTITYASLTQCDQQTPTPITFSPAAAACFRPTGKWIHPASGAQIGDDVTFAATGAPGYDGGPAIDHVEFQAWYDGAWQFLCSANTPAYSDVYECLWTLRGIVSPGPLTVTFNVIDSSGGHRDQPDGTRTFMYVPLDGTSPFVTLPFSSPTSLQQASNNPEIWTVINGFNDGWTHMGSTNQFAFDFQRATCPADTTQHCQGDNDKTFGEAVRAAASGIVVWSDAAPDGQNTGCVIVRLDQSIVDSGVTRYFFTEYCHMKTPLITIGTPVDQYDIIGTAWNNFISGTCSVPCPAHIHFSVFSDPGISGGNDSTRKAVDPDHLPASVIRDANGSGSYSVTSWNADGSTNQYQYWTIMRP
jgi:hypothetical protein